MFHRFDRFDPFRLFFLILALLALPAAAPAVLIDSGDGSGNTIYTGTSPPPYVWNYVGTCGAGSAVYLGDGWAISAFHVSGTTLQLPSGTYNIDSASRIRLENPADQGLTQYTDLAMFQIENPPALEPLVLAPYTRNVGTTVIMIGAGQNRAVDQAYWNAQWTGTKWNWTETTGSGSLSGYHIQSSRAMRWGQNYIADDGESDAGHTIISNIEAGDVISLATRFDADSFLPHEAQAVEGDSGGGVFAKRDDQWELIGIIHGTQPLPNQPDHTTVYGDLTLFADVARYRGRIESIMNSSLDDEFPWHHRNDPYDVNNDGVTAPIDALLILNQLNVSGPRLLDDPPAGGAPPPYYDVNADGAIAPLDALQVINFLNRTVSGQIQAVPEPSGLAAALGALGGLLLAGRWRRRRR